MGRIGSRATIVRVTFIIMSPHGEIPVQAAMLLVVKRTSYIVIIRHYCS